MTDTVRVEDLKGGDVFAHWDYGTPLEVQDFHDDVNDPHTVHVNVIVRDGGAWSEGNRRLIEMRRSDRVELTEPWPFVDRGIRAR